MTVVERVVVIHGAFGSPEKNWFPYVRAQFDRTLKVVVPEFPTPDGQSLDSWLAVFEKEVAPLRAEDVLIGHSIGAGFLIRALERCQPEGGSVAATLLASSFMTLLGDDVFDPINRTILVGECDWHTVTNHAGRVRVWHGSDDPYVPEALGRQVADNLNGDFVLLRGAGHIDTASGYSQFPDLTAFIEAVRAT